VRYFTIRQAGDATPVAQARASWVCVDVATGQSIPIPESFLADLAPNMVHPPDREAVSLGERQA
jgi:acyl-CoA thioesterase FadM